MNADRFQRVMVVFEQACDLEESARNAFLDDACGGDLELRKSVEAMLRSDRGGGRLETAGAGQRLLAAAIARSDAPLPAVHGEFDLRPLPVLSGQYRVLRSIGEGGMGSVYEAEQATPRRRVALKVIRSGLASREMLRRFEHEANVLGRLQHPGIAQIYEAGIADLQHPDQAFIAMELVRGKPLTEYAGERRLGARERLELVARVCDAVQHAHQRGVIHRDLKPSNILVEHEPAPHDVSGNGDSRRSSRAGPSRAGSSDRAGTAGFVQPKVLDFGVARVTDGGAALTLQTSAGQIIGTLAYMSPEQLAGDREEIDTRTDVYALGIILYELLTGRRPHDLTGKSFAEAVLAIRDADPAPLGQLNRTLRGDIETIVATATAREKTRRYQSAAELAGDIRRHLAGMPIDARRDSAFYVWRKQLMRHRRVAAVAFFIFFLVIAFGVYAAVQADINDRLALAERVSKNDALAARDLAREEKSRADATAARLAHELVASNIERGRLLGLVGSTPIGEGLIWREYLRDPASDHAYWALWELYSHKPCVRTIQIEGGRFTSIAFSPDGKWIATGMSEGQTLLWSGDLHGEPSALTGSKGPVLALAFSDDSRRIVSSSDDHALRVWNVASGDLIGTFRGHDVAVNAALFDREGLRLVSGDESGAVRIWDIATGQTQTMIAAHAGGLRALQLSPDGRVLASCGDDRLIKLWSLSTDGTASLIRELQGHTGSVRCLAFNSDGTRVASGGLEGVARVWDPAEGACLTTMKLANQAPTSMFFSPDGRRLFIGGEHVVVMDVDSGRPNEIMKERPSGILNIAMRPDGQLFATSSIDGALRLWEMEPNRGQNWLEGQAGWTFSLTFSPDGKMLAYSGTSGIVWLWDLVAGRTHKQLAADADRTRGLSWSHNGEWLASGCYTGQIKLWDPAEGTLVKTLSGHTAGIIDLAFSPDDRLLASGSSDKSLRIWDVASGEVVYKLEDQPDYVTCVAFSRNGGFVAAGGHNQPGVLIDIAQKVVLAELPGARAVWALAFSPDSTLLATGTWDSTLDLWDVPSGRKIGAFTGHTGVITSVAFSPDGRTIATASTDGTIRLWSGRRETLGQALATLECNEGQISRVRFSPDGRSLAAACQSGRVGLWNLEYYNRHILGNLDVQMASQRKNANLDAAALGAAAAQIRKTLGPLKE